MANAPGSEEFPPRRNNDNNGRTICDDFAVGILRYLDNDLKGNELDEFRSHLPSCADCRKHLEEEEALSRLLHQTRPLYSAPAALRARVSATSIQHSVPIPVAESPYEGVFQFLREHLTRPGKRLLSLRVLVPAALILAVCLALVPDTVRQVQAASYVQSAAEEHRKYVGGHLHLGLQSSSPQVVTAWFAGKVPFDFRLPVAESAPQNEPKYKLTGAALVTYKGSPAALVTYEGQAGQISLLVASAKSAAVAGGDEIQFGKLTFHYLTNAGYRVITWSNHGLAYALVSSVAGPAKASCLVCHQNMADRDKYQMHP